MRSMISRLACIVALCVSLLIIAAVPASAQLAGTVNFVVLRVSFSDFAAGSRFTTAQVQTNFQNIGTLWGTNTSYGNISLAYQINGPSQMPSTSGTYLDQQSGQSSSTAAIVQLINDAVAASPTTINWNNVYGVVVVFSDTRATGFYRGITLPSTTSISPPGGGSFDVHGSIVGEAPAEDVARTWGRWAHEMGHQMQANPAHPWHPSNYNSDFEQMDGEYPAQSGMFNKQSNMAYPGWMPVGKYKAVAPPQGGSVGLLVEEQRPTLQPDFQAIKASLTFGGSQLYYMISARRQTLGDDTATTHGPNGIPDEGVLIERVVEGGDPTIDDCSPNGCYRWVNVEGNGGSDTLWHAGNVYHSTTDGIFITVRSKPDADHYVVDVSYADKTGQPDVGINSWLQPPGNTYETTDLWVDSPINGFGTYRYPMWSDLMGGTVPQGNGDDPAAGQVNRLYARVRNYGSAPVANAVVHFEITDPPGVGVNGANGFIAVGTADKTGFPGLALIPPGGSVDVWVNWTPNFTPTPQQIQQGIFYFHTCMRVRIDHVAGETFFANQDGDGQQENIEYFQAGSPSSPGAPGAPSTGKIHLRNDSNVSPKQFYLSVMRKDLPASWKVAVNGGNPIVNLAPGQVVDIPVEAKQGVTEAIGSHHSFRVSASSQVTLVNAQRPGDLHNEAKSLGGVDFNVAVLLHPTIICKSSKGVVTGTIKGIDPKEIGAHIYVAAISADGKFVPNQGALTRVEKNTFTAKAPPDAKRAVCLYSGSMTSASAGSEIFPVQ